MKNLLEKIKEWFKDHRVCKDEEEYVFSFGFHWEKGLDDHYAGFCFIRENWRYFGEVESMMLAPYGEYMSYKETVYSFFGLAYIKGRGHHNHTRYLTQKTLYKGNL